MKSTLSLSILGLVFTSAAFAAQTAPVSAKPCEDLVALTPGLVSETLVMNRTATGDGEEAACFNLSVPPQTKFKISLESKSPTAAFSVLGHQSDDVIMFEDTATRGETYQMILFNLGRGASRSGVTLMIEATQTK